MVIGLMLCVGLVFIIGLYLTFYLNQREQPAR
jgi:hypothetical protein